MPWPAIPLSDLQTRKRLQTIFVISYEVSEMPLSVIIDPRGAVLQSHATPLFLKYGAAAYPFTTNTIDFLESEDNIARMEPPSWKNSLSLLNMIISLTTKETRYQFVILIIRW
ncbi:hypothetical protein AgCh_001291 [Apium graveolens]